MNVLFYVVKDPLGLVPKLESVLENEAYKILWNLGIKMNHPFQARRLKLVRIRKKKSCYLADLVIPADYRMNVKKAKKSGYLTEKGSRCRT